MNEPSGPPAGSPHGTADLDEAPATADQRSSGASLEPTGGTDLSDTDTGGTDASARPATMRRRPDPGLLVASAVIAAGIVLIVWGMLTAVTGDEGVDRPEAIEALSPVENAIQVLQQESVVVDLEFGYEARLTIDGVDLPTTTIGEIEVEPGEQIELPPTAIFDPGNSIISFQPADGAPIESFTAGTHRVRLVYWKIEEGPESARSYTWTFNAI